MTRLSSLPWLLAAWLCAATAAAAAPDKLTAEVAIDVNHRYQTIDGFGFSEAFQRAAQVHGKFKFGNVSNIRCSSLPPLA